MLVLGCKGLKSLKGELIISPDTINSLDLTANQLHNGHEFAKFTKLAHLIIDNNSFLTLDDFPSLSNLETFSANKNKFDDLLIFLEQAQKKFANLKNLSLVGNPLNPYFEGGAAYEKFKETILQAFPKLETLDGTYINKQGMKLKIDPNKVTEMSKKDSQTSNEAIHSFKKGSKGYKMIDFDDNQKENKANNHEQHTDRRLLGIIEYTENCLTKPTVNMNLKSQGNKFVTNNNL